MTSLQSATTKKASANRGKRAQASVGEVSGSGAGAGGGGAPEDYDSDPVGGGGSIPQGSPPPELGRFLGRCGRCAEDIAPTACLAAERE